MRIANDVNVGAVHTHTGYLKSNVKFNKSIDYIRTHRTCMLV